MTKTKRKNLVQPPGVMADIETDGLNPTLIHCLSMTEDGANVFTTTDYQEMRNFYEDQTIIVGHHFKRYDAPVSSRILGIRVDCRVVDTLALSWYLEPERSRHGLESWGEEFGVPKPLVEDWSDQPIEVYINRCEQDVRINWLLWQRFWNKLLDIYEGDEEKIWQFLEYLEFKLSVAQKQEASKWKIDLDLATKTFETLDKLKTQKVDELAAAMPKVPIVKTKSYPAKPLKKDGTLSSQGVKWRDLLQQKGLPNWHKEDIEVIDGYEDPNPNSHVQIKNWLYSLGWKPVTFKYKRDKVTGDLKEIEQVGKEHGGGICDSVKALYAKEPALEVLDGLAIISHRMAILKGFIEGVDSEGFVKAEIAGFTNTLRVKHKTVVNLPRIDKPYGKEIRGCLVSRPNNILIGADLSSLEDKIKQHFAYKFDKEYVERVNVPGYDPHLRIAVLSGLLTEEQADAYKAGDQSFNGSQAVPKVIDRVPNPHLVANMLVVLFVSNGFNKPVLIPISFVQDSSFFF